MLPSFKKLHYEKNWFTAIFHPMSRVVLDAESGQPVFYFKMTWSNAMQVFKSQNDQSPLLECKWLGRQGLQSWEVFEGSKKIGTLKAELMKSFMSLGTECWSIMDESGKEVLKMAAANDSMLKHVLDNLVELYNPTHVYTVKNAKDGLVATYSMKHGIFKSMYDFSFEKGDEKERSLSLALFAALLLMLKK